jgi:hypothetical protein
MYILLHADAQPTLEAAEDFKAFEIALPVALAGAAPLSQLLAPAGRVHDGDVSHGWIDPVWLHSAGPSTQAWQEALRAMINYASAKGWVDAAGYIRAHVASADSP